MNDHGRGMIMKNWVGAVKDKLESTIAIAVGGRDQAKEEGTVLWEHFFLGEKTKEGLRHAMLEFELHEVRKVSRDGRVSGEATVASMIRTEAPQGVGIEAKVHTEQDKLGVPGANPGGGIVVTDQSGFEEILIIQRGSVNKATTVGENDLVDTFKMIEKSRSERLSDNRRTKEEIILQLSSSLVAITDVGGQLMMVVEDKVVSGGKAKGQEQMRLGWERQQLGQRQ
jgi:hypothetical protein